MLLNKGKCGSERILSRLSVEAMTTNQLSPAETEGTGFSPDFAGRAFERFSRADSARSGDGVGLGLAIVRTIAQAHGGSAHIAADVGSGADVWVALPRRRA